MVKRTKAVKTLVPVFSPRHNRAFRRLAEQQFTAGIVDRHNTIQLDDGQIIPLGQTVMVELTDEVERLLRSGILVAGRPRPLGEQRLDRRAKRRQERVGHGDGE